MSFLPGMMPLGAVAGSGAEASEPMLAITLAASATSTATTITAPAGIQAGDVLVLLDRGGSSLSAGAPAAVIPPGFVIVSNLSSFLTTRQILSYKIADGSEAGAALTGMAVPAFGGYARKGLGVFRGDAPAVMVNVKGVLGQLANADPNEQLQAATAGPVVVIGAYGSTGATNRRWQPDGADGEISPHAALHLAYQIFNGAPEEIEISMADAGNDNCLQSFHFIPRKASA